MNLQYENQLSEKLQVLEYMIDDQDLRVNYNNPNEKQSPMI
jgi:hypothetical protein